MNSIQGSRQRFKPLMQAALAFVAFCALSLVSRLAECVFLLVVLAGIAFPLYWGRRTHDWASLGFRREGLGRALLWGGGAGVLGAAYILLANLVDPLPPPPYLPIQLAIGVPAAFLLMAPFQEFFFRGWMQPRLEQSIGPVWGITVTALCFSIWHLLPPMTGSPGAHIDVASPSGILTTLGMGLLFGTVFRRTSNIAAPWLAHALMIIALVAVGGTTFFQYSAG
jgi:membrane protease YdiL (CAAX protease family)